MRWVDVPTFARIEVRPNEFLMFRAKSSMPTDSDEFPAMDSLISRLQTRYRAPTPEVAGSISATVADMRVTPATNVLPESAATPAPRRAKRRRSQAGSSPVRIAQASTKRRKVGNLE